MGGSRRSSADRGRQSAPGSQAPIEQAVPLVRRALKVLTDREVSPQLGLLKSTLLQLDSTFSERTYGAGSFRDFATKLAAAGHVTLRESGRNVLVEQVDGGGSDEAPRHEHHPRRRHEPRRDEQTARPEAAAAEPQEPASEGPPAGQEPRMAEGIREVRRLFQAAQNPPRWPMYIRQAKQFLRNVEASFDERKFGFASLVDLLRACQREGLFRIERDRQGVMRLFPGNIMQAVAGVDDEDNRGNTMDAQAPEPPLPAEPDWAPRVETPAEAEVVEADVVQEIEGTLPVVDGETPQPEMAEAPRKGRGRGRGGRTKAAAGDGEQAGASRARSRKQPAEGAAPRARKTTKPRVTRTRKKEEA